MNMKKLETRIEEKEKEVSRQKAVLSWMKGLHEDVVDEDEKKR